MSKLALMYAWADCFQCMSKRKEPRQSEKVELRTHTGIGRTRSLWGKEQDSHGKTERDSGKPHLQDRSVHGLEYHHAEDHDTYQPTYLAREIRVDEVGWNHFVKGRKERPWKSRVAVIHTWRNIRSRKRCTYEEVEKELHERDQEELDKKRDPEEPHKQRCRWPTIHPMSKFALAWSLITMLVDATYTAFLVPIGIAFHFKAQTFSWYNAVDIAAGLIYWADVIMGFVTGFVVIYNLRRRVIREPMFIAEYYVRYGTFVPDFLASLPTIAEIIVLAIPGQPGGWPLHFVLIMRLFRMWRVVKFVERLIFISLIGRFNRTLTRYLSVGHIFTINILYATFVFMNFLACVWYYVATIEGLGNSWLTSVAKQDLSQSDPPRQWVAALYFITMTITTVGYGDITATTALEEMTAVFLMLIGIIFFGFVISSSQQLIKFLSTEARRAGKLREKLEKVEVWTQQRRIPSSLTRRIRAYYAEIWLDYVDASDDMFWAELPAALRTDMALELAGPIFAHSDIFKALDAASARQVAQRLAPLVVPAGHNVVQEGDDADSLFLLQEGELLIMRHTHEVRLVNAPAIVGESVLLNLLPAEQHVRPVTLRAIAPCVLWVLTIRDLDHIFQVLPDLKDDLLDLFRRRMEHNLKYATPEDRSHWEEMFARAYLLKTRTDGPNGPEIPEDFNTPVPGPESGLKSDVEPVSSESEAHTDEREDPNEYLQDLPPEVRNAEVETGVLNPKNDQTRSEENPSEAAKRKQQRRPPPRAGSGAAKQSELGDASAQRGDTSAQRDERAEALQAPGSSSLSKASWRSKSKSAGGGANDSAMHIPVNTPFGSFREQSGRKGSTPSLEALSISRSELERLRRMSSDTIDARQPKSDLPLMRHSPTSRQNMSSSPAEGSQDHHAEASGSLGGPEREGLVKKYRESLGPIGILGPGLGPLTSDDKQQPSAGSEHGNQSGSLHGSERQGSMGRSGSLPGGNSNPGTPTEGRGAGRRSGDRKGFSRRSSMGSRRSSALSRRMSEIAERRPSEDNEPGGRADEVGDIDPRF